MTATVGPVDVPPVPLRICVGPRCVDGPAAEEVTLTVTATRGDTDLDLNVDRPTIDADRCAVGRGAVLVVKTGTVGATIKGVVTLTLAVNGETRTIPIPETVATPNQTVAVSVCTGPTNPS